MNLPADPADPGRARHPARPEDDVRAALIQIAHRMPVPIADENGQPARRSADLVDAVHWRALRIIRRRAAVRGAMVVASVVVVIAGVSGIGALMQPSGGGRDPGPVAPASTPGPATASSAPVPSASAQMSPAASAPTTNPATTAKPGTTANPASLPDWADTFGGTALDRRRWTLRYDGGKNTDYSDFAASDSTVSGGALHLNVSRTGTATPVATSGGVGAASSAAATGRWEVRWRMTSGQGVVGQFLLMSRAAQAEPQYLITLHPAGSSAGEVIVQDARTGQQEALPVRAREFHTVGVEVTPAAVRWWLDGDVVAQWAGGRSRTGPLWPALQTLLTGPDCGATPLPADCGGRGTSFPQRLDVDGVRYSAPS